MIEHVDFTTRDGVFHVAFAGKYSYLQGDSGSGKTFLSTLLFSYHRGYRGVMEGDKVLFGGPRGAALDHAQEKNGVLVLDSDFDEARVLEASDYLAQSPCQFIFISNVPIPGFPYTDDNQFVMLREPGNVFNVVPLGEV